MKSLKTEIETHKKHGVIQAVLEQIDKIDQTNQSLYSIFAKKTIMREQAMLTSQHFATQKNYNKRSVDFNVTPRNKAYVSINTTM